MTKKLVLVLLICSTALFSHNLYAQEVQIDSTLHKLPHQIIHLPNVHPGREATYNYAKQLLHLALEVTTQEYGTFELESTQLETAQERQLRNLDSEFLDVTWSVTSLEREARFLPVRIPIMAGLFGQRALLVRHEEIRFKDIQSSTDLTSFRAVFGHDWPDKKIFEANGISVLETSYRASFRVVSEGFADMFPRSVMEISEELEQKALIRGLEIEPHIIISYPSPIFFFVGNHNKKLAERITKGLTMLFETGQIQALLRQQDGFNKGLSLIQNRKIIELNNPYLSPESRLALNQFIDAFSVSTDSPPP